MPVGDSDLEEVEQEKDAKEGTEKKFNTTMGVLIKRDGDRLYRRKIQKLYWRYT